MKISCRHCRVSYTPGEIFENCTTSWPEKRWAYFVCPSCNKGTHLEVKDEFIFVGFLDGGPGSAFIYERGYTVEGLRITQEEDALLIRFASLNRRLPRK